MRKFFLLILVGFICPGCKEESPVNGQDNFDRRTMLINWADNVIIPAYESYVVDLESLSTERNNFLNNINEENLENLRAAWLQAYISWQKVSMFEIGKAEELTLRDFTNVFPASASEIEGNISNGSYNLELPSTRDQQGFPALDYMLYGLGSSNLEIVNKYQNSQAHLDYLNDLVTRITILGQTVLSDWQNSFRDTFVNNDGSSASSSVNKLVNDYMFYYEKALRAAKIGIPAGVFSSTTLSDRVEAFYRRDASKVLFKTALRATIDFFNGVSFDGSETGESLKSYLDFLNTVLNGDKLSVLINDQFTRAMTEGDKLKDNFYEEVETNNQAMLSTYDELQANVVLLKVDMFQALNIKVDFVDADGD